MQAIILAAGKGTRLRPLTETIPKPLLPLGHTTILGHIIESLPEAIEECIIVTGYLGEIIRAACGDTYAGKRMIYAEQREDMSGTLGALYSALPYITSEYFLVLGADDIQDTEALTKMAQNRLAIGLHEQALPTPKYYHFVEHGGMVEKMIHPEDYSPAKLYNVGTGIYTLSRDVFDLEPKLAVPGEYGIPQTILPLIEQKVCRAVYMNSWKQINTLLEYEEAQKLFSAQK
jgi:UDP-N-acetylglucosamine diphosphorylase / glucose-1-phosphate thymidylyltransferase / UDP-N-acetylgalactosamine diphosphorylase / glucosamine-1-phosphate N-acetyltransferase / galactosamine-1-phosphate N-acetyltransferase